MPLNETARDYSDLLFQKKHQQIQADNQRRTSEIQNDCNRRGMLRTGMFVMRLIREGLRFEEEMAKAKMEALLSGYEKQGLPLDDLAVKEIVEEVERLCDRSTLARRMVDTARHVGLSDLESHITREIKNGRAGIIGPILRDLRMKRDEVILQEQRSRRLAPNEAKEWDVFICHASEDKNSFVGPLAGQLQSAGLRVWYDELTLKLGDSLREKIDHGLERSRFGVVVLSHHFFEKNWPTQELNGLFAKELGREKVILPVWHNVTKEDVIKYSPILADRLAVSSSEGMDAVVGKLLEAIGRKS